MVYATLKMLLTSARWRTKLFKFFFFSSFFVYRTFDSIVILPTWDSYLFCENDILVLRTLYENEGWENFFHNFISASINCEGRDWRLLKTGRIDCLISNLFLLCIFLFLTRIWEIESLQLHFGLYKLELENNTNVVHISNLEINIHFWNVIIQTTSGMKNWEKKAAKRVKLPKFQLVFVQFMFSLKLE